MLLRCDGAGLSTSLLPAAACPADLPLLPLPPLQVVAVVITQFILAYAVRDWDWWKVRCGSAGLGGCCQSATAATAGFAPLFWPADVLPGRRADGSSTVRVWLMLPSAPTSLSQLGMLFPPSAFPTASRPLRCHTARCGWPPTC